MPILSTQPLVDELIRTLQKPKLQPYIEKTGKRAEAIVSEYTHLLTMVEPKTVAQAVVRDPDDIIVLSAAIGGDATHIVTGDQDLLTIETFKTVAILSPAEFLARFDSDQSDS